jgi:hypothetical protein
MSGGWWFEKNLSLIRTIHLECDPVHGFRWSKALNSIGKISILGVLRLRASSAVSRDKPVRRSAQDDNFVGVSTKNIPNKLALYLAMTGGLSPLGMLLT